MLLLGGDWKGYFFWCWLKHRMDMCIWESSFSLLAF